MPKLIENVRESILQEAKQQVLTRGYANMTIRSVASGCGIAVGTIYNYFPSKDMLVAGFMLSDWQETMAQMRGGCEAAGEPEEVLRCIYDTLGQFMQRYESLFHDSDAVAGSAAVFRTRHVQLRAQIAALLEPVCRQRAQEATSFLPLFLAESLLAWTAEEWDFNEVSHMLMKYFS